MEVLRTSETSVNLYQATRVNIWEDSDIQEVRDVYKALTEKCSDIKGGGINADPLFVHSSIQDEERTILRNVVPKQSNQSCNKVEKNI
jgi:hypothetical protein